MCIRDTPTISRQSISSLDAKELYVVSGLMPLNQVPPVTSLRSQCNLTRKITTKILQELARLPQHKRQQNNTPQELVTLALQNSLQQILSLGIQFCRISHLL